MPTVRQSTNISYLVYQYTERWKSLNRDKRHAMLSADSSLLLAAFAAGGEHYIESHNKPCFSSTAQRCVNSILLEQLTHWFVVQHTQYAKVVNDECLTD